MKQQWQNLLAEANLTDTDLRVFDELTALYDEPHRKYHNLRHIEDCLGHLDRHPLPGTNAVHLGLAFWFHDAIYAPLRGDNEKVSAELAEARLRDLGAAESLVRSVYDLIMATTHDVEPADPDQTLMIDIDLAILGAEREEYERYEAAIRKEYKWVPGPLYRRKRKEILQSFSDRAVIYRTQSFFDQCEAPARENLRRAISRL